jgi:glycogen debranching enzyme
MRIMNIYNDKKQAYIIAERELQLCFSDHGIIAGTHHFVDLWARDSLFATFGANTICDTEISRKTIRTFLSFQRDDGLVPYRILRSRSTLAKYFGHPSYLDTPRADFRSHQSGGLVLDGGLMTIIAAEEYYRASGDTRFVRSVWTNLIRAAQWYVKKFPDTLLSEWFLCEWADAVMKVGHVLYTNVLYLQALKDMELLSQALKDRKTHALFKDIRISLQEKFHASFWNGQFFTDWIDYKPQNYFTSGSNMLAIIFGIADRKQSESIIRFALKHCDATWTLVTNYPKYPFWRIPVWNYFVGLGDYHNRGCLWLQPGILYALALWNIGRKHASRQVFHRIAKQICKYKSVYEVYERSGKPVQRIFYVSEHPFAWSAGLYLYAYHILFT